MSDYLEIGAINLCGVTGFSGELSKDALVLATRLAHMDQMIWVCTIKIEKLG